ncbi:MAG: ornithine carbamoyltransferase [Thermoplasmata archaeon]|nr:ornithine carbamoyltransferase [Thermoplasmata archaeon]RLF48921.1 MAG: ornithine carbamoyltransferase [Thermoplasmata archaeon]
MKHLISMMDVKGHLEEIIDDAIDMKKNGYEKALKDKILAMIFEKSSTRTRVSFESGMEKLGGHAIFLGKNDIQLGRGETIEDTALVLSRYVDIIMYRAYSHKDMMELAEHATVPVINGLDDEEHPCQVIADLMTIKEAKGKLEGLHVVYFGDGKNNMANSLMLGCTMAGMSITIVSPKAYWPSDFYVNKAREMGSVEITEIKEGVAKDADVIVTDTWVSMGDEKEKEKRLNDFKGYTVNEAIMAQAKDAIFMHCLPAYYGNEVTKEVAHGPRSVIFDEAENRMWAQMAIMKWLLR